MIKLSDVLITDLVSSDLANNTEMIALSYAIRKAMDLAIGYMNSSMLYSNIDNLPEKVLDILAVEWRAPYYDNNLSIEVKRKIVKETFRLYSILGTTKSIEDMVNIVFGSGEVVEWYNMMPMGTPYTFDINTTSNINANMVELFRKLLEKIKPAKTKLRRVNLGIRLDLEIGFSIDGLFSEKITI